MLTLDELRDELSEALRKHGLEQKEFALFADVQESCISRFLSGKAVYVNNYSKILAALQKIERVGT